MGKWLKRGRAAVGLGLIWAVGGLGIAGVLELLDNINPVFHPVTRAVDMWPPVLAALGFLAGTLFGVLLGIVGARRRFDELSLPWLSASGAAAGLLLGIILGAPAAVIGMLAAASALGGGLSLTLARIAERRERIGASGTTRQLGDDDRARTELTPAER